MVYRSKWATGAIAIAAFMILTTPAIAWASGEVAPGSSVDPTLGSKPCEWCHVGAAGTYRPGPHGGYTNTTAVCEVCHSVHVAGGAKLLFKATATATCLACHDGTGGYGVYGTVKARTGMDPGSSHRSITPTTNIVPGGDASTGGPRTETGFHGEGGFLGCIDCHSPHGSTIVAPFITERERQLTVNPGYLTSTNMLKQRPNGSNTTSTVYGSDWCAGCHRGRHSGGSVVNHPVDSLSVRADAYSYSSVPLAPWSGPMDITCDDVGNVYVADAGNHRIQKFTNTGVYVAQQGAYPGGNMLDPRGITFSGGNLWVSDPRRGYVSRYTTGLGFVNNVLSKSGRGSGFNITTMVMAPGGLGASPDGTKVIVTDTEGSNARVHDAVSTTFLFPMAPVSGMTRANVFPSSVPGEFHEPTDAAIGPSGVSYVVDSMNNRVQRFDSAGVVIGSFGTLGAGTGQFDRPLSIAIDAAGRVYVADSGNHRIQRFSAAGAYETSFGSLGTGPGQFRFPRGITINTATGDIYVVDSGNARIQRLSSAGAFISQWGSAGSGNGQFSFQPVETGSLAYDAARGYLYGPVYGGRGYVMQDPRTSAQAGHGPICQQCHEDSRNAGALYDGIAEPAAALTVPDGAENEVWWTFGGTTGSIGPRDKSTPRFQNFPHETLNANMLVETNDDLCVNCHAVGLLP